MEVILKFKIDEKNGMIEVEAIKKDAIKLGSGVQMVSAVAGMIAESIMTSHKCQCQQCEFDLLQQILTATSEGIIDGFKQAELMKEVRENGIG